MNTNSEQDIDIFNIDWALLPPSDKTNITTKHIRYIKLSRHAAYISGTSSSNISSLILMMFASLTLSLLNLENKTIILSLISIQFFKSIILKLVAISTIYSTNILKNDLNNLIQQKMKKVKDE